MRLKLLFKNLESKTRSALPKDKTMTPPQYMDIKILSEPKKWSAIVPSEARQGKDIRTIGFRFDFEITAPVEWLKEGFDAGFEGKCSGGFGFCEVLK